MHQIVAVHKGVASNAGSRRAELNRLIQKETLLNGRIRTNQPLDDTVTPLPTETEKVQVRVTEVVDQLTDVLTRFYDTTATRDFNGPKAFADVTLPDGTVLITKAPVDFIIFMEKEIGELKQFIENIPILDPAENWVPAGDGLHKTDPPKLTKQVVKLPHSFTKWAPPTPEFKQEAQVEVYYTDDHIGNWQTILFSGAMPSSVHAALRDRLETLGVALKMAREQANSTPVEEVQVGRKILNYLFEPISGW